MKRYISMLLTLVLVVSLCACGQKTDTLTWQEQYDLGIRYLSEGNYEEAIIAFTAAIEIDPKRVDCYRALADLYVEMGKIKKAQTILEQGYDATADASLEEYRELLENPWPALTTEQQELFRTLAAAAKAFDRATVQEIVTSEEYYYFYEEFPFTGRWENEDGTGGGWLDLTTEIGEAYSFEYWSNPDNDGELDFWFKVTEEDGYYSADYWTPYLSETRNGFYRIGYWQGEPGNENGPFKQVSWNHESQWLHITEGTARNGIRVGTETRITEGAVTKSYVVELDQEGNLIYQPEQLNEDGKLEFVLSEGIIRVVDPDHYPMDATTVTS